MGNVAIPTDTTIGYLPQVMNLQDDTTVRQETQKAFADIDKIKAKVDKLNEELASRTDYESESYMQLVEKFTNEHDRYMMMGAENYEAEIERTLTGLGFLKTDFDRPTSEFSGGWRMRIELAKYCCVGPMCYCLTSLPTTWILKVFSGWNVSCNKAVRQYCW